MCKVRKYRVTGTSEDPPQFTPYDKIIEAHTAEDAIIQAKTNHYYKLRVTSIRPIFELDVDPIDA